MVDATDKPAEPAPAPEAPDKAAAAAPGRGFGGLTQLGAVAIVAVAVLVAIYLLSGSGRPFQISLDKEGRFSVEAKPGDNFATILAAALKEDPQTVEALLAGNSFYKITSPQLVDAISRIDAKADATAEVTHGMRELLWNLAGPFQPPGTLDGADERLINALEDARQHARRRAEQPAARRHLAAQPRPHRRLPAAQLQRRREADLQRAGGAGGRGLHLCLPGQRVRRQGRHRLDRGRASRCGHRGDRRGSAALRLRQCRQDAGAAARRPGGAAGARRRHLPQPARRARHLGRRCRRASAAKFRVHPQDLDGGGDPAADKERR